MNGIGHAELILQNQISSGTIHFGWIHCTANVSTLQTYNVL